MKETEIEVLKLRDKINNELRELMLIKELNL